MINKVLEVDAGVTGAGAVLLQDGESEVSVLLPCNHQPSITTS